MKKLKMALSLILSAIVIFSSMAIGGMFASADDAVTYDFDSTTGTLTISGTGEVTQSGVLAKVTNRDDLKSVVINDGITSIGNGAFMNGYQELTSVTLPDTVTTIGELAFNGCNSLSTFTWSKNLISVGGEAFSMCTSLSELYIPKGLETIGDGAFYGMKSLEKIIVDTENKKFTVDDGVLFNAEKTQLIIYPACKEGTSYKVPDTVTIIYSGAFCYCENLTEVIIPDTVKYIGRYAFALCSNLEKINLPKTLDFIPAGMFGGCENLENIEIPASTATIGQFAFYGCTNLKYVFYAGSQEDFKKIIISSNNANLTDAIIHYNATGHTFDANGKCTKTECGYVCDHTDNTNKATCEKSAVCSKCGATLSSTGHDFSKLIKTNKATFFKDGSKVYHCTHDGCTETRTEITLSTINRILAWFRNIFSFKF